MVDIVDAATRSRMMSGIRGKNTKPEISLRHELHRQGFRYRLHGRKLPGSPDVVLPKYNTVVLVHGCFWHGHGCAVFQWPKTREEFWRAKILQNRERDARQISALSVEGWRVAVVWECAIRAAAGTNLYDELGRWIKSNGQYSEFT